MKNAGLSERFWSKVNMSGDGCWPWTGSSNGHYGAIKNEGRMLLAHRVAWQLEHGPIPAGLQVCHRCDNPICVRPSHLFVGSQSENIKDMDRKGRRPKRDPTTLRLPRGDDHWRKRTPERGARGERAGGAKLTADQVLTIRRLRGEGWTLEALAAEYGVRIGTIHFIVTGQTWRHLLPEQEGSIL